MTFAEMPLAFQIRLAVMWWAKSAPLVVIELTELQNSGWAKAHPAHPLAASLHSMYIIVLFHKC